jgi:hypothetical protein
MSNQNSVNQMIALLTQNTELMEALKSAVPSIVAETGDPSFARFTQALTQVSRDELKPLFGDIKASMRPEKKVRQSADPALAEALKAQRDEQKELFSGRGNQWIFLPLSMVTNVLDESDPVAEFMYSERKAWVRYAGPRTVDGNLMAAFELRNQGSKIPAPKNLVYMPHEGVVGVDLNRLPDGKTPHQLGLEEISQPEEESDNVEVNMAENVEADEEIEIVPEETDEEIDLDIF